MATLQLQPEDSEPSPSPAAKREHQSSPDQSEQKQTQRLQQFKTELEHEIHSYSDEIDALLARYLQLLDAYTTLRESLNAAQRDMYQCLARANFASTLPGKARYGPDYYDERMKALRGVQIEGEPPEEGKELDGEEKVIFKVGVRGEDGKFQSEDLNKGSKIVEAGEESEDMKGDPAKENEKAIKTQGGKKEKDNSSPPVQEPGDTNINNSNTFSSKQSPSKPKSNDPIRWFGILTPLPLRQAQAHAIQAVEELIPKLASVSAEMAAVELAVRRARKKRTKAEKKKGKEEIQEATNKVEGFKSEGQKTIFLEDRVRTMFLDDKTGL